MIKQPWLAAISAILLVIAIGLGIERLLFLLGATHTQGTVLDVEGRSSTCGSKRNRHRCTKFTARVQYETPDGRSFTITVSAGSTRGSDQPITTADLHEGDPLPVVYSTRNPSKAYRSSVMCVWGAPIVALGAHIATLIGSLSEGRRRAAPRMKLLDT